MNLHAYNDSVETWLSVLENPELHNSHAVNLADALLTLYLQAQLKDVGFTIEDGKLTKI